MMHEGHGLTFTVGRGTEIVVSAVKSLSKIIVGRDLGDIFSNFAGFWRDITSETQLRWIGPEKGVIHIATAAVVNALWDLWAKIEEKVSLDSFDQLLALQCNGGSSLLPLCMVLSLYGSYWLI
jgi:L-alanine-DL-glutamate epimerase-like enolase superfamily enzyme